MQESIIIAEDEPHVTRLLKLALEREGFNIQAVHNGAQALELINEQHPDMLITDINMPKMDGEQLCKHLMEQFPERKFPIIVLSSRTEIEHRDWSKAMSNTVFMEKPVSIRKLIKHIHSVQQ